MSRGQGAEEILFGNARFQRERSSRWQHERLASIDPARCWAWLGQRPATGRIARTCSRLPAALHSHRLLWISAGQSQSSHTYRQAIAVGPSQDDLAVPDRPSQRADEAGKRRSFFALELEETDPEATFTVPRRGWQECGSLPTAVLAVAANLVSRAGGDGDPWLGQAPYVVSVTDEILQMLDA